MPTRRLSPSRGHAEGTVANHIVQLEENLTLLRHNGRITGEQYDRLRILIHVHDTFKAEAVKNSPIEDPTSHASLAKAFLNEFTGDQDLLNIIQFHDVGYAVYLNYKRHGRINTERLQKSLGCIQDLNLFLFFAIIDSCTPSKGRQMITWLVNYVRENFEGIYVTPLIIEEMPAADPEFSSLF